MDYNDLFMNQDLSSAEKVSCYVVRVANAFQDLLARAEAAEEDRDRMREAMKPNCLLCDSMHENGNCTEVTDGMLRRWDRRIFAAEEK